MSLFRDTRAILVESIFWDERHDAVVWVDISAGTVHRGPLDGAVDGSDDEVARLPPPVSAIQPVADEHGGGYIGALKDEIVLLDDHFAIRERLARVAHRHTGIRFNEGKVDPWGAFVLGSMNTTSDAPDGAIYRIDASGRVETLLGGFAVANGFEWPRDASGEPTGEWLFTDTGAQTVYRARVGNGGAPVAVRPYLVGEPSDGLALAVDGSLWNGLYGGGEVVQWSGGEIARRIALPAPNITCAAFVGPELDTLLVSSARENLTEESLERSPRSGAIFRIHGVGHGFAPTAFGARAATVPVGEPPASTSSASSAFSAASDERTKRWTSD